MNQALFLDQNLDNRLLTDKQAVCFNTYTKISELPPMPRVDDSSITTVGFLYPTRESAEKNEKLGGTGFFIGRPAVECEVNGKPETLYVPFMVSNKHVAHQGAPYIKINKTDGTSHIIDRECTDWIPHPDGDDLAATCVIELDPFEHPITFIREAEFITPNKIKLYDLGYGEEVYMVGRFIYHQGREQIKPAVRQGSLSMMVEPIWNDNAKRDQECFAVEMRSRTGFSGSPVFVYRTVATNIARTKTDVEDFHELLGVNFGYILDENGENTWLNGVIPAWKILELLNEPVLKKQYEEAAKVIKDNISNNTK